MEALAKQILQKLTVLSQTDKKLKLESLVRTFFNCKSKNNRMLLLGVDNKTIIQELLGCSADAIIKEDADYFIRILKGRDDCMTISFRALSSPLTFEEQEQIKALFTFYGNDSNVNLEVAFANNRIPDLIIKKGFPTCLENPHTAIRILSGKQLISNITITTSLHCDNSLHASVHDLLIITHNNKSLVDCKVEADQESLFWNRICTEIGDICLFNFVILNNVDDHLMRAFTDLFKIYLSYYEIKNESRNILKRIFFIGDSRYYVSRFSDYLPNNLYMDINELTDEQKTISLYIFFLEYLRIDETRNNNSIQEVLLTYKNNLEQLKRIFESELKATLDVIKKFPERYHQLEGLLNKFLSLLPNKKLETREKYFEPLTAFAKELLPFAEEYVPDYLQKVVDIKEYIEKQKQENLQEKTILLIKSYIKKDKEFKAVLFELKNKLEQMWSGMKENLDIVAFNLSLETLEKSFMQTQSNLTQITNQNYNPIQKQIMLLASQKSIWEHTIKEKLSNIKTICKNSYDIEPLLNNYTEKSLIQEEEDIKNIFESSAIVSIKETELYLQQCNIQFKIQNLLYNELRKLQLS